MKALVYDEYAPDDNFARILKVKEVPDPKPKPNEVVFKVNFAGLNYDDIWAMRGRPIQIPMPHISGTDAAGEVVAVGEEVTTIKIGDKIVSHGNLSCRVCAACTEGREYDCRYRKIWGFQTGPLWGGYCEYAHLPEVNVVKIPQNVTQEEAAAASMVLVTSWHMLVGRSKIRPGQTVLIMGGASGIGTFGIQIAKMHGCDVIATASANKLDQCIKLGADFAVDHRNEDWSKEVYAITKNIAKEKNTAPGIDVVFEHIGGNHWNKELALLKYGATLVTTGATTGYDVQSDLRHIFFKGVNVLGSTQGTRSELMDGLHWMSKGKIKSIIDSVYTFENAAEAHERMLKGDLVGKILMKPT